MSLHFVLDGYNITNKFKETFPSLSRIRQSLYDFIRLNQPQGSLKNKITVIFDGKSGFFSDERCIGLEIIFSQDTTADEEIMNLIKNSANPKTIVVVTDDRDVRLFARRYSASFMPVAEFLAKKKKEKSVNSVNGAISVAQAETITKEFRKRWLDEKQ